MLPNVSSVPEKHTAQAFKMDGKPVKKVKTVNTLIPVLFFNSTNQFLIIMFKSGTLLNQINQCIE